MLAAAMWKRTLNLEARLLPRLVAAPSRTSSSCLLPRARRAIGSAQFSLARPSLAVVQLRANGRSYSTAADAAAAREDEDAEYSGETKDVMKFADLGILGLHENLLSAIVDGLKYDTMTEVQARTITSALASKDIVAQAKTGTGKTLAFLLPIFQRMINDDPRLAFRGRTRASAEDIRAIVLSPTRELAEQIGEEARKLVKGTGLVVQTAVGGTMKNSMLNQTRRQGCHLLVATPGRLNDLLSDPYSGIAAPKISALVLDEADRMLDVGFEAQLVDILKLLPDRREQPRQTLLFSATMPPDVIALARKYVDTENFDFVQTVREDEVPTHQKVPQHVIVAKKYANMVPTLVDLIQQEMQKASPEHPFKAMVFLPTTATTRLVAATLMALNQSGMRLPHIYNIHSRLSQNQRTSAADLFRHAKSAILVSSDVTARGMDFPNVSHVIQVFGPSSRDTYIHRLGRTGRQNKEGSGWLLVPECELAEARKLLPGLPITPFTGLQIAKHDMAAASDSKPETVRQIHEAAERVGDELIDEAYTSFLGRVRESRNRGLVQELGSWVTDGFGCKEPPAVSPSLARRLGLEGLVRIRDGYGRNDMFGNGDDPFGRRGSFDRGDNRRGGRDFGSSFDGGDDRRGGRGFGSSFGGGRSGGGGFGGNARGGRGYGNRDRNSYGGGRDAPSTRSHGGRSSF